MLCTAVARLQFGYSFSTEFEAVESSCVVRTDDEDVDNSILIC